MEVSRYEDNRTTWSALLPKRANLEEPLLRRVVALMEEKQLDIRIQIGEREIAIEPKTRKRTLEERRKERPKPKDFKTTRIERTLSMSMQSKSGGYLLTQMEIKPYGAKDLAVSWYGYATYDNKRQEGCSKFLINIFLAFVAVVGGFLLQATIPDSIRSTDFSRIHGGILIGLLFVFGAFSELFSKSDGLPSDGSLLEKDRVDLAMLLAVIDDVLMTALDEFGVEPHEIRVIQEDKESRGIPDSHRRYS